MVALAMLALPAALVAQQQQAPPPQLSPEVQEWIEEIQEIQQRLTSVQNEALQDSLIRVEQEALADDVQAAMAEIDPGIPELGERMEELQGEAQAAQATGDMQALQGLSREADMIQERFAAAQAAALDQPELGARVKAFQERLQEKIVEIDPAAEQLLERYEELGEKIQAAMRNGQ